MAEGDPAEQEVSSEPRMTLGEHLEELRKRIIRAVLGLLVTTVLGMCFARELLRMLERPYVLVMKGYGLQPLLQALDGWTGLGIWMKVAVYAGLVVASPWVFYQLWMFVSAGLRAREKRYVTQAVPWSAGLFITGAAFFLAVASRPLLYSLIGFNVWLGIETRITIENYVDFITNLMVIFGLAFQLPLVIYMLGLMGIVNSQRLRKYRRHVIVGIFVFAMMFTSPSGIDQVCLAIPMCLLYEAGLLMVYLRERKMKKKEQPG